MQLSFEKVTPAMAQKWINENTGNRSLRPGVVEKYAADMNNGRWTQCFMPIVFMQNGTMADGQHRLWAIVESQKAQQFIVARGAGKEDLLNIDTGFGRTFIDNLKFSQGDAISKFASSVSRWIEWGTSNFTRTPSNAELRDVYYTHKAATDFAESLVSGKGYKRAPVAAAIARAYLAGEREAVLRRFAEVYCKGHSDGAHESAAVSLRNQVAERTARGVNNASMERDLFLKAQNAIRYFCRGKQLFVIKSITVETYPLDRQKPLKAAA